MYLSYLNKDVCNVHDFLVTSQVDWMLRDIYKLSLSAYC